MSNGSLAKAIAEGSNNAAAGIALVTAALLDDGLQRLILASMAKISKKVAERIFGSYGPLYELAPKADIALALGLIDAETVAILRVIKDIRNQFAHSREILTFESEGIAKLCKKLPTATKLNAENSTHFVLASGHCANKIDEKMNALLHKHATEPIRS